MTVEEMLASDKPVLTPADIAPVLGGSPIRSALRRKTTPNSSDFRSAASERSRSSRGFRS